MSPPPADVARPALEIERKFLVRGTPPGEGRSMAQGYLARTPNEVRVRIADGEVEVTVKGPEQGTDASQRPEENVPVSLEQARRLLAMAHGTLEKTRYRVGRWVVDVYQGDLAGLQVGEVELAAPDEPLPPLDPALTLVEEISRNPAFKNASLAALSADERRLLARAAAVRIAG